MSRFHTVTKRLRYPSSMEKTMWQEEAEDMDSIQVPDLDADDTFDNLLYAVVAKSQWLPEHKLYSAVLTDALDQYRKFSARARSSGRRNIHLQEIESWITGDDSTLVPFSDICVFLGLDESAVRHAFQEVKEGRGSQQRTRMLTKQ